VRYVIEFDDLKTWKQSTKCKNSPPDFAVQGIKNPGSDQNTFFDLMKQTVTKLSPNQQSFSFPDPAIPERPGPISDPKRNDFKWAEQLEKARIGNVNDGTTAVSPDDPLSLAIGNFCWCYFPVGTARLVEGTTYEFTIRQVGVYAADKYDFTNEGMFDQFLGVWNVDSGSEGIRGWAMSAQAYLALRTNPLFTPALAKDPGYYPTMGYEIVTNNAFDAYRNETGNGCDFMVSSNVHYFDLFPVIVLQKNLKA
jgi:hypothetical protein